MARPSTTSDIAAEPPAMLRHLHISAEYLRQSRRPLASLAFILPMLVLYEGGVVWLGPAAMRNGADIWLRGLLDHLGFSQYFLLPGLTISLLLAWHHTTHERWTFARDVLLGMYVESSLLAVALLGIGHLQRELSYLQIPSLPRAHSVRPLADRLPAPPTANRAAIPSHGATNLLRTDGLPADALPGHAPLPIATWHRAAYPRPAAPNTPFSSPTDHTRQLNTAAEATPPSAGDAGPELPWIARLFGFCGAGIYEEMLFRLMLLPACVWTLALFVAERRARLMFAVLLTSVAFSAAHYIGAHGDYFDWFSFSFRFLAGAFFGVLFVYRGFGIAAGAHALYDVFVGVV